MVIKDPTKTPIYRSLNDPDALPATREQPAARQNTEDCCPMGPGMMLPIQDDINYVQGYLRTQIGKYVRVEFLIGTNTFVDRAGVLEKVGISYLILRERGSNNEIMCDMYSVKFVNVFPNLTA